MNKTIYDENNYYGDDEGASRLSLIFNPLLYVLDLLKRYSVFGYFKNLNFENNVPSQVIANCRVVATNNKR